MTDSKKPLEVQFAPGCFDHFDGTQEELDALMEEIKTAFANMTPEELAAQSVPLEEDSLTEEEWAILDAADQARGQFLQ
jgi:hypothetical protein